MSETFTDNKNAERFQKYWGDRVHYIPEMQTFVKFDTERGWHPVDGLILSRELIKDIYSGASQDGLSDQDRILLGRTANDLEWLRHQQNMLRLAKAYMEKPLDDFDADDTLIACKNGVVNLETKELVPHSPTEFHLQRANASYDPEAQCPIWLSFLDQVFNGDRELINYIHVGLGYSTTGITQDHLFFICHGNGRNGKGTLLDTIIYVLGDYARTSEFEIFLQTKKDLTDARRAMAIGNLKGKRFIVASENKDSTQLNSALVKKLTGGDQLEGAPLYQLPVTFWPTHKIWLSGNHMPAITEGTDAIWERVKAIPFLNKYVGTDDKKSLREEFKAEADGIFKWLVDGAYEYVHNGMPELPQSIMDKNQHYRDENDKLSIFIKECLERTPKQTIRLVEMTSRYDAWCLKQLIPTDTTRFRQRMEERNVFSKRDKDGWMFLHCKLKAAM
jgi:putative DNA primase/helicase